MTLLAGTLAEFDLPSLAAMTSIGRSSLRLELRSPRGELIGSLTLKAGRIVSATAGGVRGREALRVLLRATSDTRFQLAHEPLDFALSRAIASVDELASLGSDPAEPASEAGAAPGTAGTAAIRRRPTASGASWIPRSSTRPGAATRIPMMQGRLDEFDLLTLLQTVGLGRQLVQIDIRDRSGAPLGTVAVKSGKVVSARTGSVIGLDAISELLRSPESFQFAAFRIAAEVGPTPELASVSQLSIRFATAPPEPPPPEPSRGRTVAEGSLSEFDISTILHTLGSSRQHYALEIYDELDVAGTIFLKSGMVLSAAAGDHTGLRAIQHLIAQPGGRFRLVQLAGEIAEQVPLGPIGHVLLHIDAPAPPPSAAPPRLATGSPREPMPAIERPAPPAAPSHRASSAPAPDAGSAAPSELLVMEGALSDFDVRTVLEVLAATRQHARLQILEPGRPPLGEVVLKAGWMLSSQAGPLRGREALVFLLRASRQLRFRVVTASTGDEPGQPLGSIQELLAGIELPRASRARAEGATRALRWAIPLSFALGGAIVFVVVRSADRQPQESAPAAVGRMKIAPEPETPPRPPPAQPASATPPSVPTAPARPAAPAAALPPEPAAPPPASPPAPAVAPPPLGPAPAAAALAADRRHSAVGMSVKNAQSALKRLGLDPGPIDNRYGPQTRSAISQFQRSQHLPVTGLLDQDTWSAIVGQLMP